MIRFISLASGSSGNCYYIGDEFASVLIDAGLGPRTIKKRLAEYSISIDSIDLILVTHDHSDHIRHLKAIVERYNKPFISTGPIIKSLSTHPATRGIKNGFIKEIEKEVAFSFKGVDIIAFEVFHDATETLGYHIDFKGERFTFVTDIGRMTQKVIDFCKLSHNLIIESNYDCEMLEKGGYPLMLINRIKGGRGHLSNKETARALKQIYSPAIKNIYLCHLSENNNTPDLAYDESFKSLCEIGVSVGNDLSLECLPRRDHICYLV
ncbi:MAG TPA: MBL fold metallo-hydrolase [Rikenellaceae bacterium]|nr:MBL fold metallo-hydrolase [Rikenellaceae bacterium]